MKKVIILGGGTFQPIRNHLSLAAPAFGTTARTLCSKIPGSQLVLTAMAGGSTNLVSNEDVEFYIDQLIIDPQIGTIFLNIAFCDFKCLPFNSIDPGFHSERLETSKGDINITLTPTDKIISKIRKTRPDIFLVGFKTTTNKTPED